MPEQIEAETVIRAVGGTLAADAMQDFDINWFWAFGNGSDTAARDLIDTYLGNRAADGNADEAVLGFYLVVHDGGDIVPSPMTGDSTVFGGYIVLLMISGGMTLLLALTRKRRSSDEN